MFAVVSGSPDARTHLESLCAEITKGGSWIVIPQLLPSYAALVEQIGRGLVHVAWAPPLVAVELERSGAAKPVLCLARGGQTAYHSAIFAPRASHVRSLQDLTGMHVAWVDRESSAGYVLPRLKLTSVGLDPRTLFGRESFLRTHGAVARAVLAGDTDLGATYLSVDVRTKRVVSAGWLDAGATQEDVRVLTTAGPIPSDAIVVSKLPVDAVEALTEEVRRLTRGAPDALKGLFRADGFERVEAHHFAELRRLTRTR